MGIKFHCPNGHKLNVKAFLAGKKGVCPKCGTRLRIPTASEPGLDGDDAQDSDAGKHVADVGGNGTAAAAAAVAAPVAPVQPTPAAPRPAAAPVVPAAAPEPVRPAMPADPIAEAPLAIWYVRPPSGGQFGPARGDVMRKWIAEGRVSSDSLVWREGWTDWQAAGKLFPHLQAASAPATPAAATAPAAGVTRAARTVSRYQAKRSSNSSLGVALLIFLAIVCVVLVAVLGYVLFNMSR